MNISCKSVSLDFYARSERIRNELRSRRAAGEVSHFPKWSIIRNKCMHNMLAISLPHEIQPVSFSIRSNWTPTKKTGNQQHHVKRKKEESRRAGGFAKVGCVRKSEQTGARNEERSKSPKKCDNWRGTTSTLSLHAIFMSANFRNDSQTIHLAFGTGEIDSIIRTKPRRKQTLCWALWKKLIIEIN